MNQPPYGPDPAVVRAIAWTERILDALERDAFWLVPWSQPNDADFTLAQSYENFELTQPLLLRRIFDASASVAMLAKDRAISDATALSRVVIECAVVHAWLSIDPGRHLPRWVTSSYIKQRTRAEHYASLGIDLDLPETVTQEWDTYVAARPDTMPPVLDLAKRVDKHFGSFLDSVGLHSGLFEHFYAITYRASSNYVHPTPLALAHLSSTVNDPPEHFGVGGERRFAVSEGRSLIVLPLVLMATLEIAQATMPAPPWDQNAVAKALVPPPRN